MNYTLHIQFSRSLSLGLWDTETNDYYVMHILKLVYLAVTSGLLKMWRLHTSIIHNKQRLLPLEFVGLPVFKIKWSIIVNSHLIGFHYFSTEVFKTFFPLLIKYLSYGFFILHSNEVTDQTLPIPTVVLPFLNFWVYLAWSRKCVLLHWHIWYHFQKYQHFYQMTKSY